MANLYHFRERDIEELFETMTQSETDLVLYQVEWSFVISPNTFTVGGADDTVAPPWVKHNKKNWDSLADSKGPISCAAVAICRSMNTYRSDPTGFRKLLKEARLLQTQMGWTQYVSIDELSKFVELYPTYRLTCLTPAGRHFLDYTFKGAQFSKIVVYEKGNRTPDNCLYIYYDFDQKHYVSVPAPGSFYRQKLHSRKIKFCHYCIQVISASEDHSCDGILTYDNVSYKKLKCQECGRFNCKDCSTITCKNCKALYARNSSNHRCAVMVHDKEDVGYNINENDGKKPSLWSYDLEARIEITRSVVKVPAPELDARGFYGRLDIYSTKVDRQIANFVTATNVFTKEKKQFFGDNCLNEFLDFALNHNYGNSIWLAHNAASYDSRLIFDALVSRKNPLKIHPTLNGGKFMQIKVQSKVFFRDSRLHLSGSIAKLAQDFGLESKKGDFPHLFNSKHHYQYVGPIPAKRYYDLSSFKTDKDFEEFGNWHKSCAMLWKENHIDDTFDSYDDYDTWFENWYNKWVEKPKHAFKWDPKPVDESSGEWVFMDELYAYGVNDTDMLADIAEKYHHINIDVFKQSPWKDMTTASYFHKCCLGEITRMYELPDQKDDQYEALVREAAEKYWAVLKSWEYAMVSKCVRGGRTEIKRVFVELTEEERARGCRLDVVDVNSLYPFCQVNYKYPCGVPLMHIFDERFIPCYKHRNGMEVECDCPSEKRVKSGAYDLRYIVEPEWTREQLMEVLETKGGYVCATVVPPNMVHPVLVHYDKETLKCMASCEKLVKGYFTAVEFQTALKKGYTLEKLYRYDEYKLSEPIWAHFVKSMYIFKMINSSDSPKGEERTQLINQFEEQFEMGDAIKNTLEPVDQWALRSAKKFAAKIGLNSGWGKHCQRPRMVQSQVANYNDPTSREDCNTLFLNASKSITTIKASIPLGQDTFMYKFIDDGEGCKLDLSLGYIAAACYVPAYGRLKLWEQLDKLGLRVFFNDTDSVGYVYDPEQYNVETSNILGGWDPTDESKAGITGFIGISPKSYAMKIGEHFKKGKHVPASDYIKLKGIMQSRSTNNYLTFEKLKTMVLKGVETEGQQTMLVPQKLFKYTMGQGIETRFVYKQLAFDKDHQKGTVKDLFVYPHGYKF